MPKQSCLRPLLTAAIPTLFLGGIARAELIAPGRVSSDDIATTINMRPELGGTLESMQYIPFSLSDDQGKVFDLGQVVHEVVRDPQDQTLSFYYRFINAPSSSVLSVTSFAANEFKGYSTDVALLTDDPGDTGPTDAVRSNDGSTVTFQFDTVSSRIPPNGNSFTFVVKTNATQFDNKGTSKITASIAASEDEGSQLLAGGDDTIATFRPTGTPMVVSAPTPVTVSAPLPPAALSAIPTMIGSVMYMRRFRSRKPRSACRL